MREIKNDEEYFVENGVYGAYETQEVKWKSDENGTNLRIFEDTEVEKSEEKLTLKRKMCIDGKVFTISSIFPFETKSTPTEKLLTAIDNFV